MAKISEEGEYGVVINKASIIQGRWDDRPDDIEIKLMAVNEEGDYGVWYGELTNRYVTGGPDEGKLQYTATMEKLHFLGFEGHDMNNLEMLIGKPAVFTAKLNKNGYMNFYINTRSETVIDPQEANAKLSAMFQASAAPAQGVAAPAPAAQPNPFGQQSANGNNPFAN